VEWRRREGEDGARRVAVLVARLHICATAAQRNAARDHRHGAPHAAGVGHVLLVRQHEHAAVLQQRLLPADLDALALAAAAAVEEEYEGGAAMQGGG
jgi:hypothetical protein